MNRQVHSVFFLFCLLWLGGCKSKKEGSTSTSEETPAAIASLSQTGFAPGASVSIHLSEPLSQVAIRLDSTAVPIVQQSDTAVLIRAQASKIGLHQLIVQGTTATKKTISDTLSLDLWSDVVPQAIDYTILKTYPHQASSFTQGLEFHNGTLYEGTGLYGESKLMQVDLTTGSVLKSVDLDKQYFGEGISIVNNKIYQLTWTSGVCFRYTMDFKPDKQFSYHTQGWGLTHKDTTLILSDGTNKLYFLTPDFKSIGEIGVYDNKGPVMNLNELEYVNGYVYANVWQTNRIVQIDLATGKVVGNLNMERILPTSINTNENVLNGIAFLPTENAFYITGKKWPTMTKIQLKLPQKRVIALR